MSVTSSPQHRSARCRVTRDGGVATVTLNRPQAMNSLDVATKVALLAARRRGRRGRDRPLRRPHRHRSRLLRRARTSRSTSSCSARAADALFTTVPEHYNPIVTALATMPKPVIAAVNGVAAGAGREPGVRLRLPARWPTPPGSTSPSPASRCPATPARRGRCRGWSGAAKAIELLYEPRTITAEECARAGAGHPRRARRRAGRRGRDAGRAAGRRDRPLAYGAIRRSVHFAAAHGFEESLAFEAEMMTLTGGTEDHRNAVASFVAKERPTFHGR